MAKVDIESAYHLIPVHPDDQCLLGVEWENQVYYDTKLPFGLRSAPKIFNMVTEKLLCYFAVRLAEQNLTIQTVKMYLAAVRNMQISLGFPDLRNQSSSPMLKRVQARIQRIQAMKGSKRPRIQLSITPHIMKKLRQHWMRAQHPEGYLLWAVASLCFFGFFRSGELVVASESSFNSAVHLSWGDVAVTIQQHQRYSRSTYAGQSVTNLEKVSMCSWVDRVMSCALLMQLLHTGW